MNYFWEKQNSPQYCHISTSSCFLLPSNSFSHLNSIKNLSPVLPTSPIHVPSNMNPLMPFGSSTIGNVSSTNRMDQNVVSTQGYESDEHSPLAITKDSSPQQLTQWLAYHRLNAYVSVFGSFSGADLLRWRNFNFCKWKFYEIFNL